MEDSNDVKWPYPGAPDRPQDAEIVETVDERLDRERYGSLAGYYQAK